MTPHDIEPGLVVNKEAMREWVEALRSGTYMQGSGALRRQTIKGEKFCCLGVFCNVFEKSVDVKGCWEPLVPNFYTYDGNGYGLVHAFNEFLFPSTDDTYFEGVVRVWEHDPLQPCPAGWTVCGASCAVNVVDLNDDKGWTFNQIADALEWTYLREEADGH